MTVAAPGPGTARLSRMSRRALTVALVVYVAAGAWLTFGPSPARQLTTGDEVLFGLSVEELLNVALFVPFPVLVALRWPRWWWAALPLGVLGSVGIEAVQDLVLEHREPAWRDVAMNSAGAAIGTALALAMVRRRRSG